MYIVFLVEDASGGALIDTIMKKYIVNHVDLSYNIKSFKGIGTIPKKIKSHNDIKTQRLLSDLPMYLKGISKQLEATGKDNAIFVIADCDNKDCAKFKEQLTALVSENLIQTNTFFCLAIEEVESWLLGDPTAIQKAYPQARLNSMIGYIPDSVIGSWELLADVIYPGGLRKMKKECTTYREIGTYKCQWANKIGSCMELGQNESPSFNHFIKKLNLFVG